MGTSHVQRTILERPAGALVATLVPTATFIAAVAVADVWVDFRSVSLRGLLGATPIYLAIVSLPSLLPISATRSSRARVVATVFMAVVAAWAGALAIATDDAQAGLAVLIVPYVAVPLGLVLWIGRSLAERRAAGDGDRLELAHTSHRMAALLIDVAFLATVLFVPVRALADAKQEVLAAGVVVGVSTLYAAGLTARRGATLGQAALRLRVVDARSLGPISARRAVLRSAIVVSLSVLLGVGLAATSVLALPAIAELVAAVATRRSLTDRLVRTSVVTAP